MRVETSICIKLEQLAYATRRSKKCQGGNKYLDDLRKTIEFKRSKIVPLQVDLKEQPFY